MPWFAFLLFCLLFYERERERQYFIDQMRIIDRFNRYTEVERSLCSIECLCLLDYWNFGLVKFTSKWVVVFYASLFLTFSSLCRQHQRLHTELLLLPPGRHSGSHTPGLPHCVCEVWQTEAQSREPQAVSAQLMTPFIISQTLTFTIPQPPTMWQTLSLLVFGKWGRV